MGYYRFPQAVVDALAVLDQTALGHAWAEYLRASQIQVVFNDALGGPGGTVWLGGWVFFPTSMRYTLEPDRLVHELVHTTQGPYLFGTLENERGAYLVQYRYLAEATDRPDHRDWYMSIVNKLMRPTDEAYDFIRQQGPYYRSFPAEHPGLWQVRQWWPEVRYALSVAGSRTRGDVKAG